MAESPKKLTQAELIAISGKQYAGKDFLADILIVKLPGFRKIPLAQAIKRVYAEQHNLSVEAVEAEKARHRPGLIELGDWGRRQDPDYWLKQVLAEPGRKIIPDVRLKREYDLLRTHGAFLIRLNADRQVRAERGEIVSEADRTETELDQVTEWDAVLLNNGSAEDLLRQVQKYL